MEFFGKTNLANGLDLKTRPLWESRASGLMPIMIVIEVREISSGVALEILLLCANFDLDFRPTQLGFGRFDGGDGKRKVGRIWI